MPIRVLIADDHKILREGIQNVIQQHAGLTFVGGATDGREAVKMCRKLQPDVVLMDIAMKGLNGIEATCQIVKECPKTKVIALSMHSNKRFVLGMFKAGAYGYMKKDCGTDELIEAIITVAANKKFISPQIADEAGEEIDFSPGRSEPVLSAREKEILQLITEGKSSKEIGEILFLSSKTVDVHCKNIMDKLDIHTIPELTKYAIKEGLTSLDN